jgi:amino acid adenylation domain-containing protein
VGKYDLKTATESSLLPLSLSQREVWLDQMAWPGSTHLNIGGGGYINGPFDALLFQKALRHLVSESEALRLVPDMEGGQRLLSRYDIALEQANLSGASDPMLAIQEWEQNWIRVPFDLGTKPPWRIALLRGGEELHALIIQAHHLVMDGWSTSVFIQRISELYNLFKDEGEVELVQDSGYTRYIKESLEYRESASFNRDADYWHEQLPSLPEPLFDRRYATKLAKVLPDSNLISVTIPRATYDRLQQEGGEKGVTGYHWVLATLAIYLARAYERTEIVIGVPTLNRSGKRYKSTLGMFVGVIPLRITVDLRQTIRGLLTDITARLRSDYRHPHYPLSEQARRLSAVQIGRDRLFDVLLSFERQDYSCSFGSAVASGAHQTFSGKARYPLGASLCEFDADQDVDLVLEASSVCFSKVDEVLLGHRLRHLLEVMALNPDQVIEDLPLMPTGEYEPLVSQLQQLSDPSMNVAPFIRLFEKQVLHAPDAIALIWKDGSMNYGELDKHSANMANRLRAMGAGKGSIIALAMARGPAMVVAVLAIAKIRAAFLPLDREAPLTRLADILGQSEAFALCVDEDGHERFSSLPVKLVIQPLTMDADAMIHEGTSSSSDTQAEGKDLAYVLFTSGSTGQPKGVLIDQNALARRIDWIARTWGINANDRSCQSSQLTFDPSLIELLVPLTQGASVALPPQGRLLPETLATIAIDFGVTMMAFVPSTLLRFLDGLAGRTELKLRVACCGGEVLSPELATRFVTETGATLYNVYGPTEATIFATAWECTPDSTTLDLPVGRPVSDTRIYVLDHTHQLMPHGVTGDVFIGGATLAMGYLNRPDLDESAFLPDPYRVGQRMYRTGDRGWLDVDGNLHFVGRNDRQVKLRGYRIELGEIEAALLAVENVSQAAVKLIENEGRASIHAWVGAAESVTTEVLRKHLSHRLPDYMVPSKIGIMASLPTSSTGKINYAELQEIPNLQPKSTVRAPSGEVERTLLKLFSDALNRSDLNVYDNFFDQGGDSLAAVSILAGIEKHFGRKLGLHSLVENSCVADLADELGKELGRPSLLVSLGNTTRNATLYLAASGHSDLMRFQSLANAMAGACDLRMLQPPVNDPTLDLHGLAELYADRVAADSNGLIFLGGFSVGGLAALETSRVLRARGADVKEVFLVDTVLARLPPGGLMLWRALAWIARKLPIFEFTVNGRRLASTLNDSGLYDQVRAMRQYSPTPYDGQTLLIKSSGLTRWDHWLFRPWRVLIGDRLSEQVMQGLHGSLFEAGRIDSLAKILVSRIGD